jgi:hypothetical protein
LEPAGNVEGDTLIGTSRTYAARAGAGWMYVVRQESRHEGVGRQINLAMRPFCEIHQQRLLLRRQLIAAGSQLWLVGQINEPNWHAA